MDIIVSVPKKENKTKNIDSRYFARPEDPLDIEIVQSEGSRFYDAEGKQYIDFLMGWCVGNIGWGEDEIRNAIMNAKIPTYVYPHFLYKPWADLAEMLAAITPGKLEKSFRTTGGTESVEAAMQIAMAYTGRKKFVSIEGCYHGNSIATLSIGASEKREQLQNVLHNCFKIETPLDQKALDKLERRLKNEDVAAFILEPVIINLGVLIPENDFLKKAQSLCRKYGTLLVIDEVATGFGRTGKMFASEHFGIEPDIMCLAKALSGGYADIGATITTSKIAKAVKDKVNIYSTYGWHPMSVEASLACIRYLTEHQESILDNVNVMCDYFYQRINDMKFQEKVEINAAGLAIGIDTGDKKYVSKIRNKCLQEGLLIGDDGEKILLFPALNIDEDTADEGLSILENCI